MNNKSFLFFAYLILVGFLVWNWTNGPQNLEEINKPEINFTIPESKYTLPKVPKFVIENTGTNEVIIDGCSQLEYRNYANGRCATDPLTENLPPCEKVTIQSGETTTLLGDSEESIAYFQENFTNGQIFCVDFKHGEQETINELVSVQPRGGFTNFFLTIFYQPIYNAFAWLVQTLPGKPLGWAIVIVTIIIRLIILIPQQKMLVSQRKMQAIQPKIKEIQEKHKGDQAQIGMKVMELYKKEGVNPLGSCLPLLIQLPFLLVLYWVIRDFGLFENRFFLYPFEVLQSFTPEGMNSTFFGLDLLGKQGVQGVLLGLLVGGAQFVQVWLSQKRTNAKKTPEQIEAEKKKKEERKNSDEPPMPDPQQMMKIMLYVLPIMIAVFSYTIEAGVGLYWFIGTLFMIVQQTIANKRVDREDSKSGGYEIIDAKG